MQHPIHHYSAFTNQRTHYLRKWPYHLARKLYKRCHKRPPKKDTGSQWALTLQILSLAIARCSQPIVTLKKERLDELEAEDPEKTA